MATATRQSKRPSLYDSDFNQWSEEQSRALANRQTGGLDWDNLAEEIASLGRSDKREIESRLNVIIMHLLKWKYQPAEHKPGWQSTLIEQRERIHKLIRESPSLREYPAQVVDEEYALARTKAAAETGMSEAAFPARCPFTMGQILDLRFLPNS